MRKYTRDVRTIKPKHDIAKIYRAFGIDIEDKDLKEIQQIQACEATIDLIRDNLMRGTARKHRGMNPKSIGMSVGFHMLNWAPKTNDAIPLNELWVYNSNEPY